MIIKLHNFSKAMRRIDLLHLSRIIDGVIYLLFNANIPGEVEIGKESYFAHGGLGVVLHPKCKIGDRVVIAQGVTIGGRSRQKGFPIIGDDVYIGAGAKILGDITVGNNCIIGANAVVISSVPSGSVVCGVPARIIKSGINARDIEDW